MFKVVEWPSRARSWSSFAGQDVDVDVEVEVDVEVCAPKVLAEM